MISDTVFTRFDHFHFAVEICSNLDRRNPFLYEFIDFCKVYVIFEE